MRYKIQFMSDSKKIKVDKNLLIRKAAKRRSEVPAAVRDLLESGQLSTVNLVEWLIVDQFKLASNILPAMGLLDTLELILQQQNQYQGQISALKQTNVIAEQLAKALILHPKKEILLRQLLKHPSDIVRGWGAWIIGSYFPYSLEKKLEEISPLAADEHFGVREVAWMAVRPSVAKNLPKAIQLLLSWVQDEDYRIRRFAIEVTRPRGVWCNHIELLKQNPSIGLPLLKFVSADSEKYVQDSVANWLNDASKTQPDWVKDVCKSWLQEAGGAYTTRIVKRALRTLRK